MIEKPTIIITSMGRTGTQFFAHFFNGIIPHMTALHEPDIIKLGRGESLREQIQLSGAQNLLFRKALKRWSLVELSDKRLKQQVNAAQAAQQLHQQRAVFIATRPGRYYAESNSGYYGLIDRLAENFRHYRLIYLIRDGRDWVRSWMNWGYMYNKGWLRRQVAHNWPTAPEIPGDPYAPRWPMMTRFERLCWAWNRLNRYALQQVAQEPNARLLRFEDIFKAPNRYEHLQKLVDFATTFPDYGKLHTRPLEGWLEQQVHQSAGEFPKWGDWSAEQQQQFKVTCGLLMKELGYM